MSAAHGVAFLAVDRRPSPDAAVEDCFLADRNNNNTAATTTVAEERRSAAATRSPRPGRCWPASPRVEGLTAVNGRLATCKTETPVISCQRSRSSFNMKLRRKSGK